MSYRAQSPTVLLICEDPDQLAQAFSMLQAEGIEVLTYQDPETALGAIRDKRSLPQIIVTTISSQRINAWGFCERLRSREFVSFARIPILLTNTFETTGGDHTHIACSEERIATSSGLHTAIDLGDQIFFIRTWTEVGARHAIADIVDGQFDVSSFGVGNYLGNVLLRRVEAMEEAVTSILKRNITEELRRNGRREAHNLSGCLGIHRFPDGSQLAKEVEETLSSGIFLSHLDALRLRDRVIQLKEKLLSEIDKGKLEGGGVSRAERSAQTRVLSRVQEWDTSYSSSAPMLPH